MKYLSFLVLFTCLSVPSTFSQVKKQYLDSQNTSTTVVVKEDSANDMEILNNQFDINSIGMGQVIRIQTGIDPTKKNQNVPQAEVPANSVAQAEVESIPETVEITPEVKTTPKRVIQKKAVRAPRKATVRHAGSKNSTNEVHFKGIGTSKKVKTKRKKLRKKRKYPRRNRRGSSCYSF